MNLIWVLAETHTATTNNSPVVIVILMLIIGGGIVMGVDLLKINHLLLQEVQEVMKWEYYPIWETMEVLEVQVDDLTDIIIRNHLKMKRIWETLMEMIMNLIWVLAETHTATTNNSPVVISKETVMVVKQAGNRHSSW